MSAPELSITRAYLLGAFRLEVNGEAVRLPTRKTEGLLAYLLLHRTAQRRERLGALFWGDSPEELARRSLRTALASLRKAVGEQFIRADRETIQLNPACPLWVDAQELERQAREVLATQVPSVTTHFDLDLYHGDLLQDFYEDWILEQREPLRGLFIQALQHLAQTFRAHGEYRRAITLAQKIILLEPTNESAYQHLIFCQAALGQRTEALQTYALAQERFSEQLGVEPTEATRALYEQVRRADASGSRTALVKSNLPVPLTSFVGREPELKALTGIFGITRLLTLTGVGGCGKTRLAIQLARELSPGFGDGVWWFELAAVQTADLLLPTLKKTLNLIDRPGEAGAEALVRFLQDKQVLLVLDNCEHLIAGCAQLAETLLRQCPALKILATSREALSIHGEIAWLVPSLRLPPAEQIADLLQWESPRLFHERASTYRAGLPLTGDQLTTLWRICRALEGIPLAIELAAARVKTLTPEQLAARLDDRLALLTTGSRVAQPRQQTLRAAIDWSYELLTGPEQVVLQRLSIFSGTCSLEAAEFVCADADLPAGQMLDLITRLLDKSLLLSEARDQEMRYKMLEIIRQYAHEKLENSGATERVLDRHTRYYQELAHRARPGWFTPEHLRLIQQFDVEYPNLRAALGWGLERPERAPNWERGLQLAIDLGPLWNFLAEYSEGQHWLQNAVEQINTRLDAEPESGTHRGLLLLKARALYEHGFLTWFQGQYAASRPLFLESTTLFRQLEDAQRAAYAEMFLAHSLWLQGEPAAAHQMWALALKQFEAVDDRWGAAMVHSFVGRAEREAGHFEQAEREYDQCMALFSAVGDGWGLGLTLSHRGMIAFQRDDPEKARELFERRLQTARAYGFRQSVAYAIFLIGTTAWKLNDPQQVQAHMREAGTHFRQLGNEVILTECLLGLAWAAAELGQVEQAAYLLGAVLQADEKPRARIGFEDLYFHKPVLEDLQARLDLSSYQAALKRGRQAGLEQVAQEFCAAQ